MHAMMIKSPTNDRVTNKIRVLDDDKKVNERVMCDTHCIIKEIIYCTRVDMIEIIYTE
jgi:hypothetical protein